MGQHSTIHQRPLAWAGCFEIVDDRKYLISEICQSEKILENSMWAESSEYPPQRVKEGGISFSDKLDQFEEEAEDSEVRGRWTIND